MGGYCYGPIPTPSGEAQWQQMPARGRPPLPAGREAIGCIDYLVVFDIGRGLTLPAGREAIGCI